MFVHSDRGVYIVAYGKQAHDCAYHLIRTIHKYSPSYPVCLVCEGFEEDYKPAIEKVRKDKTLPTTVSRCLPIPSAFHNVLRPTDTVRPDPMRDRRVRRQKTKVWNLAPPEWEYILYLDADILVSCNLDLFFKPLVDGWDMVLTMSPPQGPTVRHAQRAKYKPENHATNKLLHGNHWLQPAGGVWSFARNKQVKAFLDLFYQEWFTWQHTDQQSMIRALFQTPLKTWILGTEWNTFAHHPKEIGRTAGIRHFATAARAWTVKHDGRSLWRRWSKKL